MPQDSGKTAAEVERLSAILDGKRELLSKITGVTGTGIGISTKSETHQVVIQIFTDLPASVDGITDQAKGILGGESAFETVVMPIPMAD